jgi:Zn finger protein HypA/HybF involved in hydrogenase expression
MFEYPDYPYKELLKIKHAEQRCLNCERWFVLDAKQVVEKEVIALEEAHKKGEFGIPFTDVTCPHCGEKQSLIIPGKYDKPFTRKKDCSLQFYSKEKVKK